MTPRYSPRPSLLLLALLALLGSAGPARGQGVPESMLRANKDTGGEVVAGLQAAPLDDSAPLDPALIRKARDTYALIRAGRHGFELEKEWNEGKKGIVPDPIKDLAFKRVDNAWNLSRTPIEYLSSAGISRQDYLTRSTQDMSKAIQLINQALALLP